MEVIFTIIAVLAILWLFADSMRIPPKPVYERKALLSDREYAIYEQIRSCAEKQNFMILFGYKLSSLMKMPDKHTDRKFCSAADRTIDFVVVNRNLEVQLLIILKDGLSESACGELDAFANTVQKQTDYTLLCIENTPDDISKVKKALGA